MVLSKIKQFPNLYITLSQHKNFLQSIKNVGSNVSIYLVATIINFWFTPYLLKHLGVEVYGLIPLATSVTNYLGLITIGLTGGLGRFITLDLEHSETTSANKLFNTSFFGAIAIAILLTLLGGVIAYLSPIVFHIPSGEEAPTRWLFTFIIGAFIVTTVGTSFSVSSYARNRIDLRNMFRVGDQLVRAVLVIALFWIAKPQVWQVGIGIFFATLFSFVGDLYLWKKLTPELSISIRLFDFQKFRQLFSFGGWQVLNQMGALLFLNISLVVLNIFVNAEAAGQYGAIILFSTAIRALAGSMFSGISPFLMKKYAQGDFKLINNLSVSMVKYFCLILGLPVGLLCGFASPLLSLWLGQDFTKLSWIFVVVMFHLPINLAFVPLFDLQNIFGKVKWPGITTLILGVLDLFLDIWFAILWGLIGVVIADAIILLIKNALFTSIYGAYIQRLSYWTFTRAVLPGVIGEIITFSVGYFVVQNYSINSWFSLITIFALIGFIYIGCVIYFYIKESKYLFSA